MPTGIRPRRSAAGYPPRRPSAGCPPRRPSAGCPPTPPERRLPATPSERRLPADDADELTRLLFLQDDVISLAQALRHMSRKAVRHRVASSRWRQVHRAVFVTHSGPVSPEQWRWIAVLGVGDHAVLGGITAAQAWGLRRYGAQVVHLLLPAVPPGPTCGARTRCGSPATGCCASPPGAVRNQPAQVVAQVRAALRAAGWPG